jgi:hypothetical protein
MRNKTFWLAALLGGALYVAGCNPRLLGAMAPLIVTGAIVGTAVALSYHDAHFHTLECGHQYRFHEGHYVYWYGDHWEYFDPNSGRWYVYR